MPPGVFEKEEITGRKRWRASQAMVNEVWKRWLREYVPDLIERRKWLRPQRNIGVNDLVLIVDQNSPRGHWPLGKIINVIPGPDNVVRSAIVKTKTGELTRPVSRLCLLEVGEEDVVPEKTEDGVPKKPATPKKSATVSSEEDRAGNVPDDESSGIRIIDWHRNNIGDSGIERKNEAQVHSA